MKILITGGGGFQGSHLAEFLVTLGHSVSIFNTYSDTSLKNLSAIRDRVTVIWGSVTDAEAVDKAVRGQDIVYHLAAHINVDESLKDPLIFFHANILGTYHILEAIRKNGGRLIFTSTCEVYGDGHDLADGEMLTESSEMRPNSPYAASKAAADRICHSYFKSFHLDVTIVRPFNIFGERQKSGAFGALIPKLVSRAMRGEDLVVYGDGITMRDYLHVSDIIQGYHLVLNAPALKGRVINFASGVNVQIKTIALYIAEKFGVRVVHEAPRPGEVSRFPAGISFARSLGFAPRVNIWEGIDRYIEWVKKQ